MLLKQADLFFGLSNDFVEHVMARAEKKVFDKGQFIFHEGQAAQHFYTLVEGCVKLRMGISGGCVFIINHLGESFGWSSIVMREEYSASAECSEPTTVMEFDRDNLSEILMNYPTDGLVFMKQLAAMLGQRLIYSYRMANSALGASEHQSHGSGDLMEAPAR